MLVPNRLEGTCRGFLRSVFPEQFRERTAASGATAAEVPTPLRAKAPAKESPETQTAALPAWVYRDAEFYALEKQSIFRREWLLAGHIGQMPKPGDYVALDAAGERALVIRGHDGPRSRGR